METIRNSQPTASALLGDLMRLLLRAGKPRDAETAALLRRVEEGVRVFEREFRAFLNGQALRPPMELEAALQVTFGELAQQPRHRYDLEFRLDALEARFHASSRLLAQRMARAERSPTQRLQVAS